jgi:transcriptional regulator with XRE-family HTH domain
MSIRAWVQKATDADGDIAEYCLRFDEPAQEPGDVQVRVLAFSERGLVFESSATFAIGASITLMTSESRIDGQAIVAWVGGRLIACDLDAPLPLATLDLILSLGAETAARDLSAAPAPASLGARMQQLRRAKGMTQDKLAKSLSVSVPAVSAWEADRSRPRPDRMDAMAKIFGVSLSDLLGLKERTGFRTQVDQARRSIALAAGVDEDKVRIQIEM